MGVWREAAQNRGGVSVGAHVLEHSLNNPVRANDKGDPRQEFYQEEIRHLHSVRTGDFRSRVDKKIVSQSLAVDEPTMRPRRIETDPEHYAPLLIELPAQIAEPASLDRSPRCVVLGKEV